MTSGIRLRNHLDQLITILSQVGISLAGLACLALVPFGLPGLWLLALVGLGIPWLGGAWGDVWILAGAALLAELLELVSSVGIAKRTGAGRQGMWGAFLGGMVGAIVLTPIFPPLGTLLGAGVGSFAGAFLLENIFGGRDRAESLRVGKGAFLGTLLGRILKLWIGVFQLVWLWWSIWFLH